MDVDELDIDKLKTAPIDLKKFSDVVEKDVIKKVLIELGKKVNIIYSDKQILENQQNAGSKKCFLTPHYNESNSFLQVNGLKLYQFKAKSLKQTRLHYV